MIKICSIGGIFRSKLFTTKKDKEEVYKVLSKLLVNMQARGTDATGLSVINTHTDKVRVYKMPIKASKFVKKERFRKELMKHSYNLVLLHTRAQTIGDCKYEYNNHPIYDKDSNNVIVHNGSIHNHKELRKKYPIEGIAEVDSEVILAMFNYREKNIKNALEELSGNMAIALYDKHKLFLYSNGNPLNMTYFKEKGTWVFSSMEGFIKGAITRKTQEYEVWDFDERLEGYEVSSNYEFEEHDFMSVAFSKKTEKPFIRIEKQITTRPSQSRGRDFSDWNRGRSGSYDVQRDRQAMSELFGKGREKQIDAKGCKRCIVEYCADRDTENAIGCRDRILSKHIERVGCMYVKITNIGFLPVHIFNKKLLRKVMDKKCINHENDISDIDMELANAEKQIDVKEARKVK